MLTYFGKFLVLLNAFAAVAVLAWSVAAYTTRVDAADAVDPLTGEKWVDEVKAWDARVKDVQRGYAPALKDVADAEARLYALRVQIARRLKQADDGKFYDIYATPQGGAKDNPNSFERVGRIDWSDDPKREIKGLDGKPLAGVDQMRANLIREQDDAAAHLAAIEKALKATKEKDGFSGLIELNADITTLDARYAWLQEVAKRHEAELPVLLDLRVNWENRGGSLQRRLNQLSLRLDDLRGSKVGAVPSPDAPSGPSAFTLTPPNK